MFNVLLKGRHKRGVCIIKFSIYLFIFLFFHLFPSVGGQPLYNIEVGFVTHWHESAMELHVFPIPIPPPTFLSTRFLCIFPVHQAWALVSCIQPGLVICFTIANIHVLMLFFRNIPPAMCCQCAYFFIFLFQINAVEFISTCHIDGKS